MLSAKTMDEPKYLAYFTSEVRVPNPYYSAPLSKIESTHVIETKQHIKFLYSDEELKQHLVSNGSDKITQWYRIERIYPVLKTVHSLELS